jgi:hypothetical protein
MLQSAEIIVACSTKLTIPGPTVPITKQYQTTMDGELQ